MPSLRVELSENEEQVVTRRLEAEAVNDMKLVEPDLESIHQFDSGHRYTSPTGSTRVRRIS